MLDIPELKLKPTLEQLHAVKMGKLTVSRVDINETWFLETREEVLAWLRSAGQKLVLNIVVLDSSKATRFIGAIFAQDDGS